MNLLRILFGGWLAFVGEIHVGIATTFRAVEPTNNGWLACEHRLMRDATDAVVASRTLPCRSQVLVCLPRTGRCTRATVGDRGPRHVLIDLAPLVARRLRSNGWDAAVVVQLDDGPPLMGTTWIPSASMWSPIRGGSGGWASGACSSNGRGIFVCSGDR
jgi:hypothetical protein